MLYVHVSLLLVTDFYCFHIKSHLLQYHCCPVWKLYHTTLMYTSSPYQSLISFPIMLCCWLQCYGITSHPWLLLPTVWTFCRRTLMRYIWDLATHQLPSLSPRVRQVSLTEPRWGVPISVTNGKKLLKIVWSDWRANFKITELYIIGTHQTWNCIKSIVFAIGYQHAQYQLSFPYHG